MRSVVTSGVFAALLLASPVVAADPSVESIGRCMAYYAVVGGMDGSKPVDAATAGIVRELGVSLYQAAERVRMQEAEMQDKVVAELLAINLKVRESGISSIKTEMAKACEAVVDATRGIP